MKRVRCEFVRLTCLVSTAIAIVVVITVIVVVVACLFSTKEHFVSCAVCAVRGAACHIAQKFLPKCFRCSFPPKVEVELVFVYVFVSVCVSRLLLHVQLQQEQEQQLQMATHFRHLQHFLLATIVCQVAAATTAAPSVSSIISNRTRCAVPLQLCC